MKSLRLRLLHREAARRCGGFEAHRQEHHLLLRVRRRQLHRIQRGIHHPDVAAPAPAQLQRAAAARHPHEVAEGADHALLLLCQPDGLIDKRNRGHTNRTARAGNQLDLLRQKLPDTQSEDFVGMGAADLHDPAFPSVIFPKDLFCLFQCIHIYFSPSSSSVSVSSTSESEIRAMAAPACTIT